jgi:ActR/RegA family two-component response regulator
MLAIIEGTPPPSAMTQVTELIKAVATVGWAALAIFAFWKLFPLAREIAEKKNFHLEIAGFKLTAQAAANNVQKLLADLQERVAKIDQQLNASPEAANAPVVPKSSKATAAAMPTPDSRQDLCLLWVDDHPENNVSEMDILQRQEFRIDTALTTDEALAKLQKTPYDAVITDMGRTENRRHKGKAGLDLIRRMRDSGFGQPVFLYTGSVGLDEDKKLVAQAGGDGATASPSELFQMLTRLREERGKMGSVSKFAVESS